MKSKAPLVGIHALKGSEYPECELNPDWTCPYTCYNTYCLVCIIARFSRAYGLLYHTSALIPMPAVPNAQEANLTNNQCLDAFNNLMDNRMPEMKEYFNNKAIEAGLIDSPPKGAVA